MGALIRAFDWARTPVGPIDAWPQSLRTALSILLDSSFPMYIAWGPQFVEFYNDAFRPILGTKHPRSLGGSSVDTWSEIWPDFVGPLFNKVRTHGEATYNEDLLVSLNRFGYTEECYFTFCYSPIREEFGAVGGVLVTCMETTPRVVGERRLRTLRELEAQLGVATTPADVCRNAASALATNALDLPFTATYLLDADGRTARLTGSSGLDGDGTSTPAVIDLTANGAALWPLRDVAASKRLLVVDCPAHALVPAPPGPWPEPPRECAIVPVSGSQQQDALGAFVVAGISARRALDDDYRGFLDLVAGSIARALASARAREHERHRSEELRETTDELHDVNQRLSASEARLRLANAAAGIGTWELDVIHGKFHCDDQCASVLGLSPGATFDDLVSGSHADDAETLRAALERARTARSDVDHADFDLEFRGRPGRTGPRWINLTGRTFFEAGHNHRAPARIVGTVHDATTQHLAQETLREEARIVETIQRVGSALASNLELPSLVQTVTDEATKLTGAQFGAFFYNVLNDAGESYTLYSISGVSRELFSKFPMPRNTQIFEPTFHGTAIVRSDDITRDDRYGRNSPYFGMPKGHLPVVSYLAVPVVSRSGEVLGGLFFGHAARGVFTERHERIAVGVAGWAAVGIDNARLYDRERRARSDAESARAEAERANRAKMEFLATMSHELRTPLNAIAGYVDLLDLEIRGPVTSQQREDLRRIQRSQQHLLGLINDVLNFAKLEAGNVEYELRAVDLVDIAAAAAPIVEPQFQAKRIAFEWRVEPGLLVWADEDKVRQILLNLLINAVKFTDPDGRVVVDATTRDDGPDGGRPHVVFLRVSDTGIGIPDEKQQAIFDPFVQLHRDFRRTTEGAGLGLSISRDLAKGMGGDLRVRSVEGKGSSFTLTLPRPAADSRSL